jgi:hypothetical protein
MVIPTEIEKARRFYEDHYACLGQWILQPGKKLFLGDKANRRCRFCGKHPPQVTFRKEAHAIPELLGNKSLFTYYECDECNDFFGRGIENDFGNWSKPMRTMARIRGKGGVPAIKRTDQGWRIEGVSDGLSVKHGEDDDPPFTVNEAKNEIVFRLTRDPYIPVAVLKAFVKMGLSLLPEEEVPNFATALRWIKAAEDNSIKAASDWFVLQTFMPGSYRSDIITALVLRRKSDDIELPYSFFILIYGNEMFQILLPTPERDPHIDGKRLQIYRFPSLLDFQPSSVGLPYVERLDLTGTTIVKDDVVTPVLTFGGTHGQRLSGDR